MANHPSAEKRNRQRVKRTDRNRAVKSEVRTVIKKARTAIETAPKDAKEAVKAAASAIDIAKAKGVVHKKAAARKKSRLARALHKASVVAKLESLGSLAHVAGGPFLFSRRKARELLRWFA
jgi:small subunit ribosomal protein S20